jgi:hypothetical protein
MHRQTKAIAGVVKAGLVFGPFAGAVYLSTQATVPEILPGIALGWDALFHVERAGAMLGAIGVVLLIAARALAAPEFPVRLGSIEYAAKEAAVDTETLSESHEPRIRLLEALAGVRDGDTVEDDSSGV